MRAEQTLQVGASTDADSRVRSGFGRAWHYTLANWRSVIKYGAPAAIMVFLLWSGGLDQMRSKYGISGDVFRYQCFAVTFWHGAQGQRQAFPHQCDPINVTFVQERQEISASHLPQPIRQWMSDSGATDQPFHTLPVEYPILTLVAFSFPLLLPFVRYTTAFAIEMAIMGLLTYALLIRLKGWKVGMLFALCYGTAAYGTGIVRFDLIPAVITLLALVCAERRRWMPAYLLLVAATFLKYYPLVLFLPLVLYHWQSLPEGRRLRELARPIGASIAVSAVLGGLMLAINPLISYFQIASLRSRPLEVESLGASIVYFGQYVGHYDYERVRSFGSDNLTSALAGPAATFLMLLAILGLVTLTVQICRRRLSMRQAWLAMLLVIVVTGKIFSTQYLIWVLPIMAYVLTPEGIGAILWVLVCALTSLGYPGLFGQEWKGFYRVVFLRNVLLLVFAGVALVPRLWPGLYPNASESEDHHPEPSRLASPAASGLQEPEQSAVAVGATTLS